MSREILDGMVAQVQKSSAFFDRFIETCPENIWSQPSGKFPVWQTVYHAIASVPFFLKAKDEQEGISYLFGPEVQRFKDLTHPAPTKASMAAFAKEINMWAKKYFAAISDADLAKKHEGFSSRVGADVTTAGVITGLAGHLMYHFGACDAALRNNGLEGLF